jgi:hypothetical protein
MKNRTLTLALLGALGLAAPFAITAHSAAAQQYYSQPPQVGRIVARDGSSFTLRDGEVVFMHPGTVINPTGADLQPGMVVTVYGEYNGNGTIDADTINLGTPGGNNYQGPRQNGYYDRYGQWHPFGNGWYDINGNYHPGYPGG